jgi:hypothetical protein
MAWLWQAMDQAGLHYGWFWLLPLVLWWGLCGLLVSQLFVRIPARFLALMLLGFAPPLFYIFTAVWKDSFMLCGLMMMVLACALKDGRSRAPLLLFIAGIALTVAVRHNALPAILPFLIWWLSRCHLTGLRNLIASVMLMLLAGAGGWYINQLPEYRTSMWPTIGLWDLAAMSVDQDKLLLPEEAFGVEDVTLDEVRREFSPLSNTTLCRWIDGRGRLVACMEPLPLIRGELLAHEDVKPLTRHWLQMIGENPMSYLRHRLRITCYLLDLCHDEHQPGIIVSPFPQEAYQANWYDGPSVESLDIRIDSPRPEALAVSRWLRDLRYHTLLMSPWIYMLLLAVMLPLLWLRRRSGAGSIGLAVNVSAWLLAAPLFFIVPNLQLRYLIWPVCAGILSVICYVSAGKQES